MPANLGFFFNAVDKMSIWLIEKKSLSLYTGHHWQFVFQAKGLRYAMSTEEELKFVTDIARATGVILVPVYR